ncbi:MAG: hypothetical protein IJ642_13555 [Oscillospiraceae bacterium]|nr:hypothetical protein [Oscillospiraceae bacterium]
MLFTVMEIRTEQEIITVSGRTSTGIVAGIWKADRLSPVIGESYQIELDFTVTERNAVTVQKAPVKACTEIRGHNIRFTALCESIDEIYYLRFGFDGLEMLEIAHDDGTIQEGDFISFEKEIREIGIYPY